MKNRKKKTLVMGRRRNRITIEDYWLPWLAVAFILLIATMYSLVTKLVNLWIPIG